MRSIRSGSNRRGMALLIVMVVVLLVALASYGVLYNMREAYSESTRSLDREQARLAARSGIEWALSCLELSPAEREAIGGVRNNQILFQARSLTQDPPGSTDESAWSFSITSARSFSTDESDLPWEYGLENESAKIHIPTLLEWNRLQPGHARMALLNLPEADERIVDAWMGAHESKWMADSQLEKSSWFDRWYGEDWNQNYRLDAVEQAFSATNVSRSQRNSARRKSSAPGDRIRSSARVGNLGTGGDSSWRRYLTWYQGQRNETWEGKPRVFINTNDLSELNRQLSEVWPAEWAAYVIAYRQFGPAMGPAAPVESLAVWQPDLQIPAARLIVSPLELIGTSVQLNGADGKRIRLSSPFSDDAGKYRDYLGRLIDDVTTLPGEVVTGRIDILSAPREVLLAIPGFDPSIAERIVAARGSNPSNADDRHTPAWLLLDGIIDRPTLQKTLPWISCRSDVYRAQVIGFRNASSPVFRCTVILDARQKPATTHEFQHWHEWDSGIEIAQSAGRNDKRH